MAIPSGDVAFEGAGKQAAASGDVSNDILDLLGPDEGPPMTPVVGLSTAPRLLPEGLPGGARLTLGGSEDGAGKNRSS
jgi:hypothetical protein